MFLWKYIFHQFQAIHYPKTTTVCLLNPYPKRQRVYVSWVPQERLQLAPHTRTLCFWVNFKAKSNCQNNESISNGLYQFLNKNQNKQQQITQKKKKNEYLPTLRFSWEKVHIEKSNTIIQNEDKNVNTHSWTASTSLWMYVKAICVWDLHMHFN